MKTLAFPILLVLTAAAAAQTRIAFPSDHDLGNGNWREGYSYQSSFPFSSGVARQMVLYESHDLNIPNNALITHVGFPRDGNLQSVGYPIRMQILMGHTNQTAATMDRTFGNNVNGSLVEVFQVQNFTLPDLGYVTPPPQIDEVWVPLDVPFRFDSSQNLLVDYRIYANGNSNRAFQYRLDLASFVSDVTAHGQGCQTSGGTMPTLTSSPTAIGQTWYVRLANGPASAPTFLNIGLWRINRPMDPMGAPGCSILVLPLASISATTNSAGAYNWSFPVPNDILLNDLNLFSQANAIDFFANALGIVVSQADQIELGMRPRMAVLYYQGDANATVGNVQREWGAVSLFRHQ